MATDPRIQKWNASRRTSLIKVLVYGDSGVGKTRFACGAPKPLVLNCEQGLASVDWDVDEWSIKSWGEAGEVYKFLKSGHHDYESLVIDPLPELLKFSMDYIISAYPNTNRLLGSQPSQPDWGAALGGFEKFVRSIRDLPMNIVCTAIPAPRQYETDPVQPMFSGKQTSSMVCRYMDIVGYMAIVAGSDGKPTNALVTKREKLVAKDRTGKLPIVIYNPTWESLTKLWLPGMDNSMEGAPEASSEMGQKKGVKK